MKLQVSILPSQQGPNDYWMLLKSGDRIGLEGLYRLYSNELFKFGLSIISDQSFVQDCIQEVFIDLWKYHKSLQDANNVKVYLFKSLSRKIGKESRKESKWKKEDFKENNTANYYTESIESSIINSIKQSDLQNKIAKALQNLPERQKEVILYLFFENFSYDEVSKIMGINLRSVYTLAWKAIASLKKHTVSTFLVFVYPFF